MRNFFSAGFVLALATSLALACTRQSPEEKLLDTAKPAVSWLATLRMTGERWIANSVPKSFVKSTVSEARKDLGKVADETEKSKAPAAERFPLLQLMREGRAAGLGLQKAAEAGDRPGAARQLAQLESLQERIAAWQRQLGGTR
jgi:3-hydroxyisobutyrate dehydrogenase-like beta-hydroxyacid dehydrogenase